MPQGGALVGPEGNAHFWSLPLGAHRGAGYNIDDNGGPVRYGLRLFETLTAADFGEDWESEEQDTWLRVRGSDDTPILVEILSKFLALPTCRSAYVHRIAGLTKRPATRSCTYNRDRRIFDSEYATDIRNALTLWLAGHRERIDLSTFRSNPRIPALEQLAYLKPHEWWYHEGPYTWIRSTRILLNPGVDGFWWRAPRTTIQWCERRMLRP